VTSKFQICLASIIGAIADRMLRTSKTFDDFRTSFQDRIAVLGRAQGLLSHAKEGSRVTFDERLNTELAAHSVPIGERSVTLDGPKGIRLRSGTIQPPRNGGGIRDTPALWALSTEPPEYQLPNAINPRRAMAPAGKSADRGLMSED
jgi:HWE histidine kinase